MTIMLRDGSTVAEPRFDRIAAPNPAALAKYPIRGLLTATQRTPRSYTWGIPEPLDQGAEGACVAHAWLHDLLARPYVVGGITQDNARPLYWLLQRRDPFAGGSYPGASPFYEGTTVEAGAQVLTEAGHYKEYRWAERELDAALAIGYFGPVILGVDWFEGMIEPNADGFLEPTGAVVGGHAILAYGYNHRSSYYKVLNSWGPGWGRNGTAKISVDTLTYLLRRNGEVCLPVRNRKRVYALAS